MPCIDSAMAKLQIILCGFCSILDSEKANTRVFDLILEFVFIAVVHYIILNTFNGGCHE